jgi:hypothetical protein
LSEPLQLVTSYLRLTEVLRSSSKCEIDSNHMEEDDLDAPQEHECFPVKKIETKLVDSKAPAAAPKRSLKNSPGAKTSNKNDSAKKYLIGEAYSGESDSGIAAKVDQVEGTIEKLGDRRRL